MSLRPPRRRSWSAAQQGLRGVCLLLLFAAGAAVGERRLDGVLPEQLGYYRIDLPDDWRPGGRLVIYNHGFDMQAPAADDLPATAPNESLRQSLLAQGYALAAGSYGSRGWALFDLERHQRALLAAVRERAGAPGEIVVFGGSLGGLVSLKTAEMLAADGNPAAGVLAVCPPIGGHRVWDQAGDVRLLFDAVCPQSPLPGGSEPWPWVLDYAAIPADIDNIDDPDAALTLASAANRIRQCTGLFQPAAFDSAAQLARRAQLKSLLGLSSDDFLKIQLSYALYPLADLVRAPEKLADRSGYDNRFVDYGDPAINAAVRRVQRDPLAAVKLQASSDPSGRWGASRVLVAHTDRDELVVPEHLAELAALARADARPPAVALVREARADHCGFSAAEVDSLLRGLREWIDRDAMPSGGSLLAACQARAGSGERCGFDPDFRATAALDSRIRPRHLPPLDRPSQHHSGAWYDPQTAGEGLIVEVLEDGERAAVAWYTYPPTGAAGEQAWIIGLGRIAADGIHVADAQIYRDSQIGDFAAGGIEGSHWGELTLAFDYCAAGSTLGGGRLRYRGPSGWGSGERPLQQLSHNAVYPEHCVRFVAAQTAHPQSRYSGSWYDGNPGEGLQFQVGVDGLGVLIWYTYDPAGNPAWLLGTAQAPAQGDSWAFRMLRPRGTRFGVDFDRAAVREEAWGELQLRFTGCDRAELSWQPSETGWDAGARTLQRLTRTAGNAACTTP